MINKIKAEIKRRIEEYNIQSRAGAELADLLSYIESLEKDADSELDKLRAAIEAEMKFDHTEEEYTKVQKAVPTYKIKGWVARYANGDLEVGREKPRYYEDEGKTYITDPCPTIPLDKSWFPELHWLDEPIEVELMLKRI